MAITKVRPNPDVRIRKGVNEWLIQRRIEVDNHLVWMYYGTRETHPEALMIANALAGYLHLTKQLEERHG